MNKYKISKNGIKEIRESEGVEFEVYKDSAGLFTVGVGHLLVFPQDKWLMNKRLTIKEVDSILKSDLKRFEDNLNKVIKVEINQNQYDALVSFAFNIGNNAFNTSSALRVLNNNQFDKVGSKMILYNKIYLNGSLRVSGGLTNRREKEIDLFYKLVEVKQDLFTDVKESDWFYDTVKWANEKGLSNGYPDGSFRPNKTVTRAEMLTIFKNFSKLK